MLSFIIAVGNIFETEILLLRYKVIGSFLINQLREGTGRDLPLLYSYLSKVGIGWIWIEVVILSAKIQNDFFWYKEDELICHLLFQFDLIW